MSSRNICFGFVGLQGKVSMVGGEDKSGGPSLSHAKHTHSDSTLSTRTHP